MATFAKYFYKVLQYLQKFYRFITFGFCKILFHFVSLMNEIFCFNRILQFPIHDSACNIALLTCLGPGNTKGGSITVLLTSCFTGMDSSVLQIKTRIVSCHTAESKPGKQEVNGTVILPLLVFPAWTIEMFLSMSSNPRWPRQVQ